MKALIVKILRFFYRVLLELGKIVSKELRAYQKRQHAKGVRSRKLREIEAESYHAEFGRRRAIRTEKKDWQRREQTRKIPKIGEFFLGKSERKRRKKKQK